MPRGPASASRAVRPRSRRGRGRDGTVARHATKDQPDAGGARHRGHARAPRPHVQERQPAGDRTDALPGSDVLLHGRVSSGLREVQATCPPQRSSWPDVAQPDEVASRAHPVERAHDDVTLALERSGLSAAMLAACGALWLAVRAERAAAHPRRALPEDVGRRRGARARRAVQGHHHQRHADAGPVCDSLHGRLHGAGETAAETWLASLTADAAHEGVLRRRRPGVAQVDEPALLRAAGRRASRR